MTISEFIKHPIVRYYLVHPIILFQNRLVVLRLSLNRYVGQDSSFTKNAPKSNLKIDIVIPVIEKDLETLPYVIDSVRENIRHPIGNIFLISPSSNKIEKVCKHKKCKFIFEEDLIKISKKDIPYKVNGVDRSGWLYQQLLKWSADKIPGIGDAFLITDADTVYCRPQVFEHNNKIILSVSHQFCHIPYFDAIKKLTGKSIKPIYNVTSHHSLFELEKLSEIKKQIEKHTGKVWYRAIISLANSTEGSCVSDYETYGQLVYILYPKDYLLEHWFNGSISYKKRSEVGKLVKIYTDRYKSLSFHTYNK
ncbi:MAG: hypothetical protein US50_C0024G0003 [Candidatus Nomurabacteria bacterium GW2011_GWB1_37_5]|uniref:Glycosyltransferase 2-like domain-containing protein n=1 Tax=Candidatus Nomurabacteria bacterium GW2011_GWB1_37_5 TaxID=1618742 RepID=A0A0G0JEG1_9BACT|nr:MAG: hypothetical protein US50_C0024G0003 [Candidatus Nomurabacteria bacterium GW2011_GWB1_37_5]